MDLWNVDKLTLFLLFAIPGFLMLKANSVLGLAPITDSSKQLIDAVAYSCINYALLAWPIFCVEASNWRTDRPELYFGFYAFAILVAPVIWALAWHWIRTTEALQKVLPHPTARPWDYVFGKRRPYWVIATFKDGMQVAGRYASNSFSSAAPSPEQIYLEEAWVLNEDGGLDRPRTNSEGILILGTELRSLEFFQAEEEQQHGNKTEPRQAAS
jgi:hypothetical protein